MDWDKSSRIGNYGCNMSKLQIETALSILFILMAIYMFWQDLGFFHGIGYILLIISAYLLVTEAFKK